ncbi:MAG: hypothetical protein WC381_08030 [Kiritimatiellia bacterium]
MSEKIGQLKMFFDGSCVQGTKAGSIHNPNKPHPGANSVVSAREEENAERGFSALCVPFFDPFAITIRN